MALTMSQLKEPLAVIKTRKRLMLEHQAQVNGQGGSIEMPEEREFLTGNENEDSTSFPSERE